MYPSSRVLTAVPQVWCLSWISHMFVTGVTKSPRLVHLDDVVRLTYELGQCPVYHIPSKRFDGKKDGYVFRIVGVGLGYYYNDDQVNLLLERLR
jgi:hypothetical protein